MNDIMMEVVTNNDNGVINNERVLAEANWAESEQ